MTKVKDVLTRQKATEEILISEDLIEEKLPVIALALKNYPDTWINSMNKNLASFLVYLQGIDEKYNKEIKPNLR